jgi:hypothetical protein
LLFEAADGWYPLTYFRTVALSPITGSLKDLFTATGLPDDPLSPPVGDADALVGGAVVVSLGAGAAAEVVGEEPELSEEPESLLQAVSSAPPTIIAATAGRQV